MELTSSVRSAPPPYTSNLPDLDRLQQSQVSQGQTTQEYQQVGGQPRQTAPQQLLQPQQIMLQQAQQLHQLAPQHQVQQYPTFPQSYILQPQLQPFYYQYPPRQNFAFPVPFYPIPGPVFYHPFNPYQIPYIYQPHFPQAQPFQASPPQLNYPPLPFLLPFPAAQASSPPIQTQYQQQAQISTNDSMQILQAVSQAGFIHHPPAIIPGIPGVHQYPLIVRKEGGGRLLSRSS
ncbi:hypothetical protein N431DRAFT_440629 [Stipitochalara longipes BDJ]|nr:hypothetical protein N431DRAFT_440629 [Stipitochalara longipes BDJ]